MEEHLALQSSAWIGESFVHDAQALGFIIQEYGEGIGMLPMRVRMVFYIFLSVLLGSSSPTQSLNLSLKTIT